MARALRHERDSLGAKAVPARALYGIFIQRALETFQVSGRKPHPALIRAYARIEQAAARANAQLGLIPARWAAAIVWAAERVIANLANERLGGHRDRYEPIHPNNHVNLGQSSNDVTPTAIRLMALELSTPLTRELDDLERAFRRLDERERIGIKPGRTHLHDAVPITYGQVFTGSALRL